MRTPNRTLWFVRHGERVDNVDKEWKKSAERWDDPPLSTRGHYQAREVGTALADEPIDYVFCSPFTRCVETATEILSQWKAPPPIFIEPGLGESLNVCMSPPGRPTMGQIKQINPNVDDSYIPVFTSLPPEHGGDAGCIPRVAETIGAIIANYPTGNILFVSHGSPIAACHLALCGSWRYVGQCTIGKITGYTGNFHCEYYGDKRHLSDKANLREVQTPKKSSSDRQRREALTQMRDNSS
ncbi:unnamed protein product [Nippostrongylus brasiliensis]|uniref:Phosphoglycerate mutase family protein n=1 Tax=Nippostrongylus brasiliensis TaxID=27835 RepID=A0A158QXU2_NIPBR|nr:unnamed protein product [Nippostrongylus brasiliensis]